jgi:hypothetical protein
MNAELDDAALESMLAESLIEPAEDPRAVSDDDFAAVVAEALESVAGRLLFKIRVGDGDQEQHVAAASVGERDELHFLLLTQPVQGGALKVESTAKSSHPLARIAPAYAGLMDVMRVAA